MEVIGERTSELVAGVDGVFHEAAPLLAAPDRVLVVELGGGAAHGALFSFLSLSEGGREGGRRIERALYSFGFYLFNLSLQSGLFFAFVHNQMPPSNTGV